MNGLLLLLISMVALLVAYFGYGRYLERTWGVDSKAKTPAVKNDDGVDFVPSSKWEVFAHQFSSIAGAGPVTGPVMALMFGWVPTVLWILIGEFSLVLFRILEHYMHLLSLMESQWVE